MLPAAERIFRKTGILVAAVKTYFLTKPIGTGKRLVFGLQFDFGQNESFIRTAENIYFPTEILHWNPVADFLHLFVAQLQHFFGMGREQATRIMLTVHTEGRAACGTYPRDIAETKAAQVNRYAREHQHPLLCEIEAAGDA